LEVYFERASTSLHEDSAEDLRRLAKICRRFSRDLVLFVSGQCGRNAPEFIKWLGDFTVLFFALLVNNASINQQ
jgi:hypothetical protein